MSTPQAGYPGSQAYRPNMIASEAPEALRLEFIRKTYAHLGGAVLLFAALEAAVQNTSIPGQMTELMLGNGGNNWIAVLLLFMAVGGLARWWAKSSTSLAMQYLGLFLYVLAEVAIFVPLIWIANHFYPDQPNMVRDAGILTAIVFGGLTFTVLITKKDFSFLRQTLVVASCAAFGIIILAILGGFNLGIVFSAAMVLLASGYILYHTSNILHHYPIGSHVAAALALFSAVALLFWYIIRIFMDRRR